MGSLVDYVKRTIKNNIKLICLISFIIISFACSNRSNDDYAKKITQVIKEIKGEQEDE